LLGGRHVSQLWGAYAPATVIADHAAGMAGGIGLIFVLIGVSLRRVSRPVPAIADHGSS
jgi:hypothetical protein